MMVKITLLLSQLFQYKILKHKKLNVCVFKYSDKKAVTKNVMMSMHVYTYAVQAHSSVQLLVIVIYTIILRMC